MFFDLVEKYFDGHLKHLNQGLLVCVDILPTELLALLCNTNSWHIGAGPTLILFVFKRLVNNRYPP